MHLHVFQNSLIPCMQGRKIGRKHSAASLQTGKDDKSASQTSLVPTFRVSGIEHVLCKDEELVAAQVDKNVGGGVVPAYIQATNSQIINNVATTQGGGINAATCDAIVLYNTVVSGNFGEALHLPHPTWQVNL